MLIGHSPRRVLFLVWILFAMSAVLGNLKVRRAVASKNASIVQKKAKVVFLAGRPSHGYGAHEHYAGCVLLAKSLQNNLPGVETEIHRDGWPRDAKTLADADSIVMYCDGAQGHLVLPHLEAMDKLAQQGVGIVCIHYGVEVPKGEAGDRFLDWIGGYFELNWSVNPHWTAHFSKLPDHPITRGVKPFAINDEWYYHLRFRPQMKNVTPILTAVPPKSTLSRRDGPRSGNPAVRKTAGQPQHVAWAAERPGGGRGFGFTGGHDHWNWGDPNFRKLMLNAILWTTKVEVPSGGVSDQPVTVENLEENQDYTPPKNFNRNGIRQRLNLQASDHRPQDAVAALDVADGLEATLFASEPQLLSLTNLDIDHRGRVWVCEVVNYRKHNGKRPEGDRILILEDRDGDGRADQTKVFYQGRDVDSAMGICVLGNKVIVSATPNVLVFTDEDGDDRPDKKEKLFTKTGQPQHDHSAHSFLFGPDGKMYWNFGNTGQAVHDKDGNVVVDLTGNQVIDQGKPYYGGMPFRCNLDGSEFEVLAHNFRNNYETAVDSFGTLWQSDNDDDGNRAVRINYVMQYGNYGYRDQMTGATWKEPRTGMAEDVPTRHWHQRDPGVIPNLLQTGAGSPVGIMVYEGRLLPKKFWDQMLHCEAGTNVVRAYPVRKDGAGYHAEVVNLLHGARDNWFRPADVCVAPDGSVFVTDWYDPGVGGHNMGDLQRGRLFRVAPPGHKYEVPSFNFDAVSGAVAALKNPNLSVRYLAWTALHRRGKEAEAALLNVYQHAENPRHRARALWLLGKIDGRGEHYVTVALKDKNPDIRILGLRLAHQLKLRMAKAVAPVVGDAAAEVRREAALALRFDDSSEAARLWAKLANAHDGQDRWYLEALGIGADLKWDACLDAWLEQGSKMNWNTPAGRDIIWRSRAKKTPQLLAKIIQDPSVSRDELPRLLRALDFQTGPEKEAAVLELAFASSGDDRPRSDFIRAEALARLGKVDVSHRKDLAEALERTLQRLQGTTAFITLVDRFGVASQYPHLLMMAQQHADEQLGVDAIRVLLEKNQHELVAKSLANNDPVIAAKTAQVLGNSADGRVVRLLLPVLRNAKRPQEVRRQAARAMAQTRNGAERLIALARTNVSLKPTIAAASFALNGARWPHVKSAAASLFPLPAAKNRPLPPLAELVETPGDGKRGAAVFAKTGQCAKCHIVGKGATKIGKEVGPDLSEIGGKLSRHAMFESIIFPSAGISHNYESYTLILESGNVVTGIRVNETQQSITLKSDDAIARTFAKSEVEEIKKQPISLMPADLQKTMTVQDLADVVEYLTTLKAKK